MFFRREEICAIAYSGNPLPTFRDNPSVLLDSWPLKMEPTGCPETSVVNLPLLAAK